MSSIDVRTAYIILGMLYLALPTAAFIVLAGRRGRTQLVWCGGGLAIGIAIILLALRAIISDEVSILGGNFFIFIGSTLLIQALRIDLGRALTTAQLAALALVPFVVLVVAYFAFDTSFLRALWVGLAHGSMFLYVGLLAWQLGRQWQSRVARWVGGIYTLLALALFNRAFFVGFGISHADPIIGMGIDIQLIPLAGVFSAIIGNFGYVGMVLNRTQHQEEEAVAANARAAAQRDFSEQLAALDRQRSLGELAAAFGHELNQPLTAMLTNAQVARRALAAGRLEAEQLVEFLEKIDMNSRRAEDILASLGRMVGPDEGERRPVELMQLIDRSVALMRTDMDRHGVRLVMARAPQPVWVLGDVTQLSQVLVNLLRNAIEALQLAVQREMTVRLAEADGQAEVSICDTGCGLGEAALTQAGTAFFTTKPDGLGMGLAISRTIIQQHQGELTLTPGPAGGACSRFILPTLKSDHRATPP